jgi:hypothetical protein
MALIFSLSAECGSQPETAKNFANYFNQISWQLSNGINSISNAEIFRDSEDNWWTRVSPTGITQVGITTPEDAYYLTEIGILLYQHLQSAPSFRYALVGVEVDEFQTYSELITATELQDIDFPGLVLSEAIWQLIHRPPGFRKFAPGYVWKLYEGEVFKPLMVSLTLKEKLNELLAVSI